MLETVGNLARHKLRNGLTIGGIVIGTLALTTMGAMAEKTNRLLEGGIQYFADHVTVTDSRATGFGGLRRSTRSARSRSCRAYTRHSRS